MLGIYICHCGRNIAGQIKVAELVAWARHLPGAGVVRQAEHLCSEAGQDLLRRDIREQDLKRVVVAACSPRMHETTFRRVVEEAGLNGYMVEMANIREGCAWVTGDQKEAQAKARGLIAGAVARVTWHQPLENRYVPANRALVVVGGGIAGLQAAIRVAEAGHPVYLVEREASLGGNMSRFDRTFPTLDCAACTISALMVKVAEHPQIQVLTLSEVQRVEGHTGAFRVQVVKRPRYVTSRCTGCGDCTAVCPVGMPDTHNEGMVQTRSIGRPFPFAVPSHYRIHKNGEAACSTACPAGVNVPGVLALLCSGQLERAAAMLEETLIIPALAGIYCRGYCQEACAAGTGVTGINVGLMERELYFQAFGSTGRSTQAPAPRVAVVGAGPAGLAVARRLAESGCRVVIFERQVRPGGMLLWARPGEIQAEVVLAEEMRRLAALGVKVVTGVAVGRDLPLSRLARDFDAVVLALGAWRAKLLQVPGENLPGVYHALSFLDKFRAGGLQVAGKRVVIVGAGDTGLELAAVVARHGAAAVWVLDLGPERSGAWQDLAPLKVPVQFCWGFRVTGFAIGEAGLVVEGYRTHTIPRVEALVADLVIIAAGQLPETEELVQEGLVVDSEGRLVTDDRGRTPRRGVFAAGDLTAGGGSVPAALAAGGQVAEVVREFLAAGPGALWPYGGEPSRDVPGKLPPDSHPARRSMDYRLGRGVQPAAGPSWGRRGAKQWSVAQPGAAGRPEIPLPEPVESLRREAERCRFCGGCSGCGTCARVCQAGAVNLAEVPHEFTLEAGAIILATGYQTFDPAVNPAWGYGSHPDVLTGFEFERICSPLGPTGGRIVTSSGREPEAVAILHCVGSRDRRYRPYCSRVCCMAALKFAQVVREQTRARVFELYVDLRTTGKGHESFLRRVQEEGVIFVRGRAAQVETTGDKLTVRVEDTLLGAVRELAVDMVILCTALEPRADAEKVARIFGVQRDPDGFFLEAHPKMAPMASAHEGVLLAGACQGPKDITESLAHAAGAAAEALALLARGELQVSPEIAHIDPGRCSGCGFCLGICPYEALSLVGGKAQVREAACRGCGACLPACPVGALGLYGWEDRQLAAQIAGLLKGAEAVWDG